VTLDFGLVFGLKAKIVWPWPCLSLEAQGPGLADLGLELSLDLATQGVDFAVSGLGFVRYFVALLTSLVSDYSRS